MKSNIKIVNIMLDISEEERKRIVTEKMQKIISNKINHIHEECIPINKK